MPLSLDQVLAQLDITSASFRRIESGADTVRAAAPGQVHVVAVLQGSGTVATAQGPLPVAAGQLLLLAGDVAPQPGPGLVLAHGLLAACLLDRRSLFEQLRLPHRLEAAGTELFTGAIPELLRESAVGGPGSDAIITCLARRLVTALLRDAWSETDGIGAPALEARRARLDKIVALMRKDPGRDHTLDALAGAAALSRTLFHREFVRAYGVTPLGMLRSLRLQRAQMLLRQTDMPIKTITARLGYRSRSHFCKLFKEAFGAEPERYRRGEGPAPRPQA